MNQQPYCVISLNQNQNQTQTQTQTSDSSPNQGLLISCQNSCSNPEENQFIQELLSKSGIVSNAGYTNEFSFATPLNEYFAQTHLFQYIKSEQLAYIITSPSKYGRIDLLLLNRVFPSNQYDLYILEYKFLKDREAIKDTTKQASITRILEKARKQVQGYQIEVPQQVQQFLREKGGVIRYNFSLVLLYLQKSNSIIIEKYATKFEFEFKFEPGLDVQQKKQSSRCSGQMNANPQVHRNRQKEWVLDQFMDKCNQGNTSIDDDDNNSIQKESSFIQGNENIDIGIGVDLDLDLDDKNDDNGIEIYKKYKANRIEMIELIEGEAESGSDREQEGQGSNNSIGCSLIRKKRSCFQSEQKESSSRLIGSQMEGYSSKRNRRRAKEVILIEDSDDNANINVNDNVVNISSSKNDDNDNDNDNDNIDSSSSGNDDNAIVQELEQNGICCMDIIDSNTIKQDEQKGRVEEVDANNNGRRGVSYDMNGKLDKNNWIQELVKESNGFVYDLYDQYQHIRKYELVDHLESYFACYKNIKSVRQMKHKACFLYLILPVLPVNQQTQEEEEEDTCYEEADIYLILIRNSSVDFGGNENLLREPKQSLKCIFDLFNSYEHFFREEQQVVPYGVFSLQNEFFKKIRYCFSTPMFYSAQLSKMIFPMFSSQFHFGYTLQRISQVDAIQQEDSENDDYDYSFKYGFSIKRQRLLDEPIKDKEDVQCEEGEYQYEYDCQHEQDAPNQISSEEDYDKDDRDRINANREGKEVIYKQQKIERYE